MKKIILLLLLTGCSTNYEYLIDPRSSKEPREILRDKLECRELAKPYLDALDENILGIPFCKSKKCWAWDGNFDPVKKCLVNRGHSIIN